MLRLRSLLFSLAFVRCLMPAHGLAQNPVQGQVDGPLPAPKIANVPDMTNDSVLKMVKAGLDDGLIVQTIQTQPGHYEIDADSLLKLKQAGVSNPVIAAMANKNRIPLTGPEARAQAAGIDTPAVPAGINEIGVYYKDRDGKWEPLPAEIVHIKSGGFLKSTLSDGIIKQDRNGHLDGRESKLLLPRPIEFLIYAPDGVEASEYDLLRFRLNSNAREFRTLTGGVFHSTGGAKRDEVPFTPVKIAPRTWQFTVDQSTPGGEYGILPPGTGNVTNGGKIYTFAISE